MTIHELKNQRQQKQSEIFQKYGVFFAFSDQQFEENKTPLEEGDKYARLFGGGFCPKSKVDAMLKDLQDLSAWFQDQINTAGLRDAHILYELNNHEAFYTGEIEDTMDALGKAYTMEEVLKVYKDNRESAYKAMGW